MAHASYLIGLSRPLIEGLALESTSAAGQPGVPALRPAPPAMDGKTGGASLAGFLAESHWQPGGVVLVVPTDQVIFRRLKFPFSDPKKIRQALRFELEADLLEDVGGYVIEQEIFPAPDGGAEVASYLTDAERVRSAVATCRAAEVQPFRVTFSAQALLAAYPAPGTLVFQVYAGVEEVFVSCIRDGRMDAAQPIATGLADIWIELNQGGVASARDLRRVLAAEGTDETDNTPRARLIAELRQAAAEINLFLRVHGLGEDYRVDVFGLYGPCLAADSGGQIKIAVDMVKMALAPERRFLGILNEVQGALPQLRRRQGVNFYRAGAGWLGQFAEYRRPLLAAAALLALWAVLAGGLFVTRTIALARQRAATEAELRGIVNRHVPSKPPLSTGLSVMRERAQKNREEGRGLARFADYQYDALALLAELSAALGTASGVTVDSLSFGRDRLALGGATPSFQATEALKSRIESMARYKGKPVSLNHQRTGQTITFRLTVN